MAAMISFTLRCSNGHRFDSWFASNAAFDGLLAAGHVTCIDCGTTKVSKAMMAPAVTTVRTPQPRTEPSPATAPDAAGDQGAGQTRAPVPAAPASAAQPSAAPRPELALRALAALRKHVESSADYVGKTFASEVRAIDAGTARARPIWGEVTGKEARALHDDGLPVAALPFGPRNKSN